METPATVKEKKLLRLAIDTVILLALIPIVFGAYFITQNKLDKKDLMIGGQQLKVEIVDRAKTREKGLSGRQNLDQNQGMLFIFQAYSRHVFWMKDMNFPLDMIWLRDGEVIGFEQNLPPGGPGPKISYRPSEDINQVLEVPARFVAQNNIKIGDRAIIK